MLVVEKLLSILNFFFFESWTFSFNLKNSSELTPDCTFFLRTWAKLEKIEGNIDSGYWQLFMNIQDDWVEYIHTLISIELYSGKSSFKFYLERLKLNFGDFFPFFGFVLSIIRREPGSRFLGSFVNFADIIGVKFVRFSIADAGDEGSFDHFSFFFYKYYKGSEFCLKVTFSILIISDLHIIPHSVISLFTF